MAGGNIIRLIFAGDTRDLEGATRRAGDATESMGERMRSGVTTAATAGVAAIGALGVAAIQSASELEQAYGGVDAVFGASAQAVKDWASDTTDNIRIPAAQVGNFATLIGAQLKNAGIPMDQLAGKTQQMVGLGADFAAMYGGTAADAVAALSAGLRGEFDSLDAYGLAINQASIEAKKAELGLAGLTGEADRNATATAYMALLNEQGADALGAAGREASSFQAQMDGLSERFEAVKVGLGQQLLPYVIQFGEALQGALTWIGENQGLVNGLVIGLGSLAVAVLAVNGAVTVWRAGVVAYTAVQWLLNAAMAANPIGLLVLGIGLLVGALVWAWTSSETFRGIVLGVWEGVKSGIGSAVDWVVGAISWFANLPGMVGGWFASMRDAAVGQAAGLVGWLSGLPGRVLGAIGNLGSLLLGAGGDLISGLWSGIQRAAGWLRDRIFGFFGSLIPGWVKNILGIRSPSKVFADLGQYIPAGMAQGIEGNAGVVQDAVTSMSQ
ncbi:MAG: hypothetical protein L0H64_15310, partial [Pseudonocardia sp.]|nr:hypothetical protein [Pseudonocardia sp.]